MNNLCFIKWSCNSSNYFITFIFSELHSARRILLSFIITRQKNHSSKRTRHSTTQNLKIRFQDLVLTNLAVRLSIYLVLLKENEIEYLMMYHKFRRKPSLRKFSILVRVITLICIQIKMVDMQCCFSVWYLFFSNL